MARRTNATGYAGVHRTPAGNFSARIAPGGGQKPIVVGTFATAIEAAVARDRLVRSLGLSAQARLNFEVEPEGVDPQPTGRSRPRVPAALKPRDLDDARVRRMVARADKVHGAALEAERRRVAEEPRSGSSATASARPPSAC